MVAGILGWTGTIGTFLAYVMVTRGHVSATSRVYAFLNIGGGILGGAASAVYGAWPSATSNFVWAIFGVGTLVSVELKSRRARPVLELCASPSAPEPTADDLLLAS